MARSSKIDIKNLGWKVTSLALGGKSNTEIVETLNREDAGCGITGVDVSRYLKTNPVINPVQVEIVERAQNALVGDTLLTLETARKMLGEIRDEIQRQLESNLDPKAVSVFVTLKLQAFDRVLAVLRLDQFGGQFGPFAIPKSQDDPQCQTCWYSRHLTIARVRELLDEDENGGRT